MKLAILNANNDRSDFAAQHPNDVDKFSQLLKPLRPDWFYSGIDLVEMETVSDVTSFDGYILTGSPASVNDDRQWIRHTAELVKQILDSKIKLFGACFGHQMIAKCLGTKVMANPSGWCLGSTQVHRTTPEYASHLGACFQMYAAHTEQVADLPRDCELVFTSFHSKNAGFKQGRHLLTTQYHPEMTDAFINALVEKLKSSLSSTDYAAAKASLNNAPNATAFAQTMIDFFES